MVWLVGGVVRRYIGFSDKRWDILGYIPRINCSAMIAVFLYTLEASNCTLQVYHE